MLSDRDIEFAIGVGDLKVDPYRPESVQGASLDVRLGRDFIRMASKPSGYVANPFFENDVRGLYLSTQNARATTIEPGEMILGVTLEYFELSDTIVGMLNGKSSLGRLGLLIHLTAGFVDPGYKGALTLEILNVGKVAYTLLAGMPIGQLALVRLDTPAKNPYSGKYGSILPERSAYYKNPTPQLEEPKYARPVQEVS